MTAAEITTALEQAIAAAGPEELPPLLGEIARIQAVAALRLALSASRPPEPGARGMEVTEDRLLTVAEVAGRLNRSKSWVYRKRGKLPFFRPLPGGRGGFSAVGLAKYLARAR